MDDLELDLPTGALIAGDAAAVFADARPLVIGLPKGCFPVTVAEHGLEVVFTDANPVDWTELPALATPSGYVALLDADALSEYTDLGDEPADEFELLAERFEGRAAAHFGGVLAAHTGCEQARLALGRDANGMASRILLRFTGEAVQST